MPFCYKPIKAHSIVMVREQLSELQGKSRREREKGMLSKKKNRGTYELERKKNIKWQ
jgi:hypothetical protein